MIELYTGTPGSGKSLHCASAIYKALRSKKNVIANFDINLSAFKGRKIGAFLYCDNGDISPDFLMKYAVEYHRRNTNGNIAEGQTILVIDECQILYRRITICFCISRLRLLRYVALIPSVQSKGGRWIGRVVILFV